MGTLSTLGSLGSETSALGRGRPMSTSEGGPMTAYQCAFACMTELQSQLSPSVLQAKLEGLHQPLPSNYTTVSAKKRKNAAANRYSNVLPYDYNCVKVQPLPGSTDKGAYINASLLQASGADPAQWRYIATQGPLPNTTEDFWNMVVDQECRAIVMLTRVAEDHATKCSQYFPLHEFEQFQSGNVTVHCMSTMTLGQEEGQEANLTLRNLKVVIPGKTDEAGFNTMHYAFHCWPDHAAPPDTRSVRSLMQAVNQVTENSGVACIHCSAGIGRTGTYIAIDIILKRLSALTVQAFTKQSLQQALDVDGVIRELRLQRMGMVQTVEQLEFIYTCLTDALREIVVAGRTR